MDQTYTYKNKADRRSHLHMDDVALDDVARAVGTPVYVYSQQRILAQLERLQTAFASAKPHFHFSLKSNNNGHLIRLLVEQGCGCDVVSAGEIYLALRAGCALEDVVFAGVGKTRAEMRYALEQRIGWFNVENPAELAILNELASEAGYRPQVALRLNPAVQAATHKNIATGHAEAKFGIPIDETRAILADRATYTNLDITGLHMHIGSQLGRPDESAVAASKGLAIVQEFGLTSLNMGGGFPVSYTDAPVTPVEAFAEALLPVFAGAENIQLMFEPGRYLVAESAVLLAEVQYVKHGGRTVVVDAGMNDLVRPALYEASHPIWSLVESQADRPPIRVVGPICESSDVLNSAALLPPLKPGDRVAVGVAGAYGYSMASNYNGRPRPAEVLVNGDTWRIIRQRETFEDFVRHETV